MRKILLLVLAGLFTNQICGAQTTEPERQQLLNGLRILIWTRPGDPTVFLKLRIHSGAAFDPAGKAGTMALLGDILFPDASTHEYFTEEEGGRLEVKTDYNSINITLQGRSSDYDRIVDILRGAILTTPLTPENVTKVREARIKALSEQKTSLVDLADERIAKRLLGSFPYAQPVEGSVETVARIDRADLMLARERFLTANNATLAIVGGVDERRAMRALRQLLGGWTKGNEIVPATFRQPDAPRKTTLLVNSAGSATVELRVGLRGLSRSDPDYYAATLLPTIVRERWRKLMPEAAQASVYVRHEAQYLPGIFAMGATVNESDAAKALTAAREVLKEIVGAPFTTVEIEAAKRQANASEGQPATLQTMADSWLDIDTYGLQPLADQARLRAKIAAADLHRVAARLFDNTPTASVAVGDLERLSRYFNGTDVELELKVRERGSKTVEQKPAKVVPAPRSTPSPSSGTGPPLKSAPPKPN